MDEKLFLSRQWARQGIDGAVEHSILSAQHQDNWNYTFSGIKNYEKTFREILEGEHIVDFTKEKDPSLTLMLDFMGQGKVLEQLGCQHGLAVELKEHFDETGQSINKEKIQLITGNVLLRRTWDRIREWLQSQDTKTGRKFHLILARPLGGLNRIPEYEEVVTKIFVSLYSLLSSEKGCLLTEVPKKFDKKLEEMVAFLNQLKGIQSRCHLVEDENKSGNNTLLVFKNPGAPENLAELFKTHTWSVK